MAAADCYEGEEPLNVSLAGGLTITELAQLIKEIVGYKGEIIYDLDKPDGAMVKTFTNDRIKKALGWTPQTTMKDGISMTLQWLLENWESATAK